MFAMLCLLAGAQGDLFTDDGILVYQTDTVRKISGFWTMVITIHPPEQPELALWSQRLMEILDGEQGSRLSESDKVYWKAVLNNLRLQELVSTEGVITSQDLLALISGRRTKRGLLNIFGKMGQSLFGTAMDSDVTELRHAVDAAKQEIRAIYHNEEGLLSVLNQTLHFMQGNRQDIEDLQQDMGNLQKLVNANINQTTLLLNHVTVADVSRKIDQNLAQMKMVRDDFLLK